VGCRRKDEKKLLLRVARTAEGVVVDPRQRIPGRGAYVHRVTECFEKAIKNGGLAKTLRAAVPQGLFSKGK
jgi:predicted RNA-binding protein YlxR (DUF448 family)